MNIIEQQFKKGITEAIDRFIAEHINIICKQEGTADFRLEKFINMFDFFGLRIATDNKDLNIEAINAIAEELVRRFFIQALEEKMGLAITKP
jgi:hypothetical protein